MILVEELIVVAFPAPGLPEVQKKALFFDI